MHSSLQSIGALLALFTVASAKTCNVDDYGAVGDAQTYDTQSIQHAIDDCAKINGVVTLSASKVYLSGSLRLTNRVTLNIPVGAELRASTRVSICAHSCEPVGCNRIWRVLVK
jgi:polygalacturonase